MRKCFVFCVLILLLLLSACQKKQQDTGIAVPEKETSVNLQEVEVSEEISEAVQETEDESLQVLFFERELFTKLVEEEKNYKLYTNENIHGYYYEIISNDGKTFATGFCSWRFAGIDVINDSLLMVSEGSGMALFSAQYFDVKTGRVSKLFGKPLGACSDLVAYFDRDDSGIKLVVRDLFDADTYYREFRDESFDTPVFYVQCTAVFSSDQTSVTITYPDPQDPAEFTSNTFELQ